tara:strand:+ start:13951 stop:14229 length:279 start_codon:yes stop_codon:yes gene_type:complete
MSKNNVLNFDEFKIRSEEIKSNELKKKYQSIVEGVVQSMMDVGIEFDDRTEKAIVPLLKILENILYTQHGVDHRYTKEVNRFIEEAFNKKLQ